MKKLLTVLLCIMLLLAPAAAFAQETTWLSPWVSLSEIMDSPRVLQNATAQVNFSIDTLMKMIALNEESESIAQMISDQYADALDALMGALRVEAVGNKQQENMRVMLDETEVANLTMVMDENDSASRLMFISDCFPSYAVEYPLKGYNKAAYDQYSENMLKTLTQYQDVHPVEALCDLLRAYLLPYLNGQTEREMTAAEYFALSSAAGELLPANTFPGAMLQLYADYCGVLNQPIDTNWSLFDNADLGSYTFSNQDGLLNVVHTYLTQENAAPVKETYAIGERYLMSDAQGKANDNDNIRMTLDGRQDNLISLRVAHAADYAWVNWSRDADGQSVYANISTSEISMGNMNISMNLRINKEGKALSLGAAVSIFDDPLMGMTMDATYGEGKLEVTDLTNYKKVTTDENGQLMATVGFKRELYDVARPKMLDIVLSKMPEAARPLTTTLVGMVMRIGQ